MRFHTITQNPNGTVNLIWNAPAADKKVFKELKSQADAEMLATDITAEYLILQVAQLLENRMEETKESVMTYDGYQVLLAATGRLDAALDLVEGRTIDAISLELK